MPLCVRVCPCVGVCVRTYTCCVAEVVNAESATGRGPLIVVRVACAMHFWRIVCMPHIFASRWRSVGGNSEGGEIGKDVGKVI